MSLTSGTTRTTLDDILPGDPPARLRDAKLAFVHHPRMWVILAALISLFVGFFGGRFVEQYKRAQTRRDDLMDRCDDMLDHVARLHEVVAGDAKSELERLMPLRHELQRAADRYLDGRDIVRPAGQSSQRRIGLEGWSMRVLLHSQPVDLLVADCLRELHTSIRDLPTRIIGALDTPMDEFAQTRSDQLIAEVRSFARTALKLRDAVSGRPPERNRGMYEGARRYLYERGRLPNLGLGERSGLTNDDW